MNLKEFRISKRLSQSEFAKIAGTSQKTISNYESGLNVPDVDTVIKLADYFGCSIDYLLGHQKPNTLQLDELSETQQKLVDVIRRLTPAQASFALGYFSDMLGLPYSSVRPTRPF